MGLVVYCADIGSVPRGRFGWARGGCRAEVGESSCSGTDIVELIDAVTADLAAHRPVALGFECPLFVPVPERAERLGAAREGEGNRAWSAGAGSGAMATGLVEVAWMLRELRALRPDSLAYLDWEQFVLAGSGLFLWEAFVTGRAKAANHVDDARAAVEAFREALPDVADANAVNADRPMSLLGAAMLWSGLSEDIDLLHMPCVVVKAQPAGGR